MISALAKLRNGGIFIVLHSGAFVRPFMGKPDNEFRRVMWKGDSCSPVRLSKCRSKKFILESFTPEPHTLSHPMTSTHRNPVYPVYPAVLNRTTLSSQEQHRSSETHLHLWEICRINLKPTPTFSSSSYDILPSNTTSAPSLTPWVSPRQQQPCA